MSTESIIKNKLATAIELQYLEVLNESSNHNVPPGSESHFKLVLVADVFEQMSLLSRHRMINEILAEELKSKIHALAIHVFTPAEWENSSNQSPKSPPCLGGEKTV